MREPARRYKWADATPGSQIARKHGTWAADVDAVAKEIVDDLLGVEAQRHPVAALVLATTFVRWLRASADIAERGVMIGTGKNAKAHPLLGPVSTWERTLLAGLKEFGLTPAGEATLAKDRAEATRYSIDLDAIRARGLRGIEARSESVSGAVRPSEPRNAPERAGDTPEPVNAEESDAAAAQHRTEEP